MTRQKPRLLVIDDDEHICALVNLYFSRENYIVCYALNGKRGLELFEKEPPDLVILDIMLPETDGWEVCREIRKVSNIPIIMLTARGESFDKVLGLELGADDYVVKPFDPKELVARVKAVLRRSGIKEESARKVIHPNLVVDMEKYEVNYRGHTVQFPPKEIELLYLLAAYPDRVFTREQLLRRVWGEEYTGENRTVDVHVKRLREKLGEDTGHWRIKTVWGVGYKFELSKGTGN